ncbi:tigger transposable element-derived protein 4-like [Rhopalosiphum maidis]|uniref:tigger transposable element-derived protein 4-like n=1 Tax=Rhopalosiphum maidis TaxID=43146 RepID=UPI000F0039C3|nr:tigger transposable element-derived protein 4-like [Rhopalosiphum maidis]
MENVKRKLNVLPISDKIRLISLVEKGDRKKCEIAKEFNIPPNTLSSIIKQKDKILKFNNGNVKKMRTTPYLDIDSCLLKWFTQCRDKNIPVSRKILLEKSNKYAQQLGHTNFKASNGWLTNWKKRHDVVFRTVNGESPSTVVLSKTIENIDVKESKPQTEEEATAVSTGQVKHALKTLRHFFETTTVFIHGAGARGRTWDKCPGPRSC